MSELTAPAPFELQAQDQPENPPDLNARQIRFCREYSVDQDGKAAAVRAGYSPRSADMIACENLKKVAIRAFIEELQTETLEQMGVNPFRVLREMARTFMRSAARNRHFLRNFTRAYTRA